MPTPGWYLPAIEDSPGSGGTYADKSAPWRGVLHSTEGRTYASARGAYVKNNSWPHFTVSGEGGRFQVWQHTSVLQSARALRNAPGGVETGRLNCVQIEIVGTCDPKNVSWGPNLQTRTLPTYYLAGLRDLMRWCEREVGIRRHAAALGPYPSTYGAWSGRMSAKAWMEFNGWCGHCNVPENTHGDPGLLDTVFLLGDPAPRQAPVPPLPEEDEMQVLIGIDGSEDGIEIPAGAPHWYALHANGTSTWIKNLDQKADMVRRGWKDLGTQKGIGWLLNTYPPVAGKAGGPIRVAIDMAAVGEVIP